jgi:hypothetical protein
MAHFLPQFSLLYLYSLNCPNLAYFIYTVSKEQPSASKHASYDETMFLDICRSSSIGTVEVPCLIFSWSFPKSVNCSHTFYFGISHTCKSQGFKVGDHRGPILWLMTCLQKTSPNASIEVFDESAIALSCIKCLNDFSSSVGWWWEGDNQSHIKCGTVSWQKNTTQLSPVH